MPYKMEWNKLLLPQRYSSEESSSQIHETRSNFQRDYDRVIFSSPFRRLQNKTQVFPLPGSVFVHNRLTHSLEVASVGRSLGNSVIDIIERKEPKISSHLIEQIPTIISTACLAHDLGNPPFGHSGEESIRSFFLENSNFLEKEITQGEWSDLIKFEGNANAIRLLTQKMEGKRAGGFRLSYPVLSSIVKYPWESTFSEKNKFGFFQTEKEFYSSIAEKLGILQINSSPLAYARHPLVYLVEAADDICYQIMDIEDAHKLGILPSEHVHQLFLGFFHPQEDKHTLLKIKKTLHDVTDANEQIAFLRSLTIGKLTRNCSKAFEQNYESIMHGDTVKPLIEQLNTQVETALNEVKKVAYEQVYNHRTVVEIEIAGYKIINTLLHTIGFAMLDAKSNYSRKVLQLIPKQYIASENSPYQKIMAAVDFVSGMTDVYALEMYRILKGISIPGINR
jgi:dGTPase